MFDLTVELFALGSIIGYRFSAFRTFFEKFWDELLDPVLVRLPELLRLSAGK